MIIGIDLDDVCIDMMSTWIRFYNRDFSDNLTKDIIEDWDISKYVKPEAKTAIYDYINKPEVFLESKPVLGALDYIKYLRTLGHRIIYITANNPMNCKQQWLEKWGFLDDMKNFIQCYDKSLISVDALLDDRYENCRDSQGTGWLLTQPWNRGYDYPLRVKDWTDFIRKIV
jgi:5'(3')-deoxyribonucleotidase